MTDHIDLVAEIPSVEKMATQDRLKHAKKRRSQQLKKWANYEKQLDKEHSKKSKKGQQQNSKKQRKSRNIKVRFKGNIMLLESAARGDLDDVKRLLSAGVNPDVTNEDGLTALHQCCIDDNEEMLKLLLEFGAQVNARDSELWTPLHAAATCGHVHLCRHLIEKGAELLAVNADGNMPYDICEDEVTLDYIETEMAKRGVTQDEIDDTRLIPERQMLADLKTIASKGGDLEFRGQGGATPLHVAAANGYIEVTNFLLDHHVSVDLRDYDSWQPIHAAACWLQPEILEILVSNGSDIDAKTKNGETAFDLCEDAEIKQKILDMKDEMETNKASRSKENVRRHKHSTRTLSNSSGSLYSSNTSLNDHHHRPTSASIRRSSMRGEKNPLFMKEAKEEALHFGWRQGSSGEDDIVEDDKENLQTTNIDDIELRIDDDTQKSDREKDVHKTSVDQNEKRETLAERPTIAKQNKQNNTQNDIRPGVQSSSQIPSPNYSSRRNESGSRSRQSPPHSESQPDRPRHSPDRIDEDRTERSDNSTSPKGSSSSYHPGSTAVSGSGSSSQPRYPTGTSSITLADLKRQRAESRSRENSLTDISSQVQNMFINSLNSSDSKKYSSSSLPEKVDHNSKNGHNTNNNTQSYPGHGDSIHRFKAPGNTPVVGGEEKDGCCVIL